jgi:hypothetical protein
VFVLIFREEQYILLIIENVISFMMVSNDVSLLFSYNGPWKHNWGCVCACVYKEAEENSLKKGGECEHLGGVGTWWVCVAPEIFEKEKDVRAKIFCLWA